MYYSKYQVKVRPAVIHYKGVNGVLETQEPRGAVRWRSVASYRSSLAGSSKSVQEQHNRESDINCTRSCSTYLRHGSTSKPRKVMW